MAVLNEGYRKARKPHRCDGWHWIEEDVNDLGLDRCTGIKKGDEYYFQTNTDDGLRTFKCCKTCKENADRNNLIMSDKY